VRTRCVRAVADVCEGCMRVCTSSHVCGAEYTSLSRTNSLLVTRDSRRRLEIRDFAGTIFARLFAMENIARRDRKSRYRALFWTEFCAAFSRLSHKQKCPSGKWRRMWQNSIKPVCSRCHCYRDAKTTGRHRMQRAAKVLSLLRSSKRLALMLAFLIFIDPFLCSLE